MKKWISMIMTLLLVGGTLGGCSGTDARNGESQAFAAESGSQDTAKEEDGAASGGQESQPEEDGTKSDGQDASSGEGSTSSGQDASAAVFSSGDEEMFTDRDRRTEYDKDGSVSIQLNKDSASASSDSVKISGSVITITEEATYIISGTLEDGQIVVNASDSAKIQLVLDQASVNSETSAPLYILEADKVFVTLAEGTENTLSNGGTFTAAGDSNIDGAIFSRQDLTINGSGTLNVTSPAGHGIVCKDDLVITGGTYTVNSASHGLQANDSVRITGDTTAVIEAGKDGIHAENDEDTSLGFVYISGGSVEVEAEGDGVSAGAYLQIEDGSLDILAGGGSENGTKESSDAWGSFGGAGGPGRGGAERFQNGGAQPPEDAAGGTPPDAPGQASDGAENTGSTGPDKVSAGKHGADNGGAASTGADMAGSEITGSDQAGAGSTGADMVSSRDTGTASGTEDTESEESSTSMKGLKAAAGIQISGGTITINSADDGVHSNTVMYINGGTFEIATGDDGFHADETLAVTDGVINITESYEGLEALHVRVEGGEIRLVADDDGLNAAGGVDSSGTEGGRDAMVPNGRGNMGGGPGSSSSDGTIVISGGTLHIQASGDGIDANGTLSITGGYTVVEGPTQGDTATLDYDVSAEITGGTFIGTGASGMAQSFSSAGQGVVAVSVGTQEADTAVTLTSQDGDGLLSVTPEMSFNVVILSSPELVSGETYTLTVGETSGDVEAG